MSRAESAQARLVKEWPIGRRLEVLQEDEGYWGAWFAGVVVGHPSKDGEKLTVEYDELNEYDDETEETVKYKGDEALRRVRPEPSTQDAEAKAAWAAALTSESPLQLYHIGGWWDVVLQSRLPSGQIEVKAKHYDVTHTVTVDELRPAAEWVWDVRARLWKLGWKAKPKGGTPAKGGTPSKTGAPSAEPVAPADDDEVLEAEVDVEVEVDVDVDMEDD